MKVLFYFGVFARVGGIEEFTRDLALALHAQGMDVEIVCASIKSPILDSLKQAGVKIFRIPVYYGCRWNIPDYALFPFALSRIKKADVVIHQKPFRLGWYRMLSRKPKHVYITAYRPAEQFTDPSLRISFFSFFDLILTQVDAFAEDILKQKAGMPVDVIPYIPAAPDPVQECGRNDGVLRIGMMGRLEQQKNPLYALSIVQKLCEEPPEGFSAVEFHIYGSGSLEEEVQRKAEELKLPVFFHGVYMRSAVQNIVRENDLFLITSVSEGQCIVALEIVSTGRPLFATPIGALPTILEKPERGALLPVSNADEAVQSICQWMKDNRPVSAQKIQRSYLEDYDQDQIQRRYGTLLRNLVTSN